MQRPLFVLKSTSLKLLSGVLISLFVASGAPVRALTPEQTRILDSNVLYFNHQESEACSLAGSGGQSGTTVASDFTLGTDGKERRVNLIKVLMADYSFTPEQASGPVGNFMAESGGAHLPPDINEGDSTGAPPQFSGGYGWAQWTGGRQRSFIQFAVDNGYMESAAVHANDGANYAYLKHELASASYQATITELRKQSTPEDAAVSFEATFERAGVPRLEARKANARQAYTEFLESGGAGGSQSGSCGGASSAAIVGEYAFPLMVTKSQIKNRSIFRDGTTNTAGHPYTAYDILVDPGTPVAAFLSGKVVRISEDRCPGRYISIYNEKSDITVSYLHLDFNNHVGLNETVEAGQQIGLIGAAPNGCGTPHLHIDAAKGNTRPGCSRLNCPTSNSSKFIDIGPELFQTYQVLAE